MKNYFKPKKLEFYHNKTIYEFIGIKLYKKYLPTTGDLARRYRNIVQIKPSKSDRINELYSYEKQTRRYEIRHIMGLIGFIILFLIIDKNLNLFDVFFLTVLNLYVNIYPIFLQRHNRIRIINILLKYEQKTPYKK